MTDARRTVKKDRPSDPATPAPGAGRGTPRSSAPGLPPVARTSAPSRTSLRLVVHFVLRHRTPQAAGDELPIRIDRVNGGHSLSSHQGIVNSNRASPDAESSACNPTFPRTGATDCPAALRTLQDRGKAARHELPPAANSHPRIDVLPGGDLIARAQPDLVHEITGDNRDVRM
jgi:hypothetical protein